MRTIWNGSISFGLVNIEDADLEAITLHDESRSIEITRFVPLDEVDPVYLDRTYYLAPAQAPAQRRPYVLLLEAMKQAGMGGIGRFVLRGAEYFALIRPKGDALVLETLFLAEDVRSQAEIDEAVAGTVVKKAELDLAQQVMQSLVGEFDPSELHSQYRSDLRQMLEAKLDGQEIAKPEPVPDAPVLDLMEALKRSVAEVKGRKTATKAASAKKKAAPKSGSSSSRRQPARKSA